MPTTTLPAIPNTIPPAIVSKFNIGLVESKFQQLADEASSLVFNSDNIEQIKAFIKKGDEVEKNIIKIHKEGKEPSKKICDQYDEAKRSFIAQKQSVFASVETKFNAICLQMQEDERKVELEKKRVKGIMDGISNNAVNFARMIAEATTTVALTRIESIVNLEKSRKEKYQEFLPEAIGAFNKLNANLKNQKEAVRLLEDLEKQKQDAITSGNEEQALEIMDRQDNVTAQIEERKTVIQEAAVNSVSVKVIEPEVIVTSIKAKRSTWKWELVNGAELLKKRPELAVISANKELVDAEFAQKRKDGLIKSEDFTENGIRYFLDKTF